MSNRCIYGREIILKKNEIGSVNFDSNYNWTKEITQGQQETEEAMNKISEENRRKKEREILLTQASEETAIVISEFKNIVKEFIELSEEQTKATNKLNKALFWFTLITVIATVVSTAIAIIQFIK